MMHRWPRVVSLESTYKIFMRQVLSVKSHSRGADSSMKVSLGTHTCLFLFTFPSRLLLFSAFVHVSVKYPFARNFKGSRRLYTCAASTFRLFFCLLKLIFNGELTSKLKSNFFCADYVSV